MEVFLTALKNTLLRFGSMDVMFIDKGPAFKAIDVKRILAKLDVGLIPGKTRYPQGHGKIEAFNRSVRARLLRSLAHDDIDPHPDHLTLRLQLDLFEVNNQLPHESLKQQTPYARFFEDERP